MDDMWVKRGENKTNVTREGPRAMQMHEKGFAVTQRCNIGETKLELMVLHEYKPPKCFPNTSLTIRLSRLLIRTDTSLDRDSRGTPQVRPNPVVTGSEHFPYNTCPKADQNCAGLMRAERHVTRRDVVSSQKEGTL